MCVFDVCVSVWVMTQKEWFYTSQFKHMLDWTTRLLMMLFSVRCDWRLVLSCKSLSAQTSRPLWDSFRLCQQTTALWLITLCKAAVFTVAAELTVSLKSSGHLIGLLPSSQYTSTRSGLISWQKCVWLTAASWWYAPSQLVATGTSSSWPIMSQTSKGQNQAAERTWSRLYWYLHLLLLLSFMTSC